MRFYALQAALFLSAVLVTSFAGAQEITKSSMDVLREQLGVDKKFVVAENLILTESQEAAFWPIYEQYQQELRAIDQRVVRLVNEYADAYNSLSVTDAKARQLLDEAIAIDEAEVALRKKFAARLYAVIPAIEVARYLQLENKIRAVVRFDLADAIPLVE
jgi:hypothetical protein